jgi:hypothetical protein
MFATIKKAADPSEINIPLGLPPFFIYGPDGSRTRNR